jgi:putative DNA primase/helicase
MRDIKERVEQALAGNPLTEDAIALRFAAQHEHDLRYVDERSTWFKWDNTRWQPEKTLLAYDLIRDRCRADAVEFGNGKPPAGVTSAKTVAAVERLAKADRRHATTIEQWDSNDWTFNAEEAVDNGDF